MLSLLGLLLLIPASCGLPPLNSSQLALSVASLISSRRIGGTVSGLSGPGLVASLNGRATVSIVSNGPFWFPTTLKDSEPYNVQVTSGPATQTCTASSNTGTVSGRDVTSVVMTCATTAFTVGGSVTGLSGAGLTISLNGGAPLSIPADGSFTFPAPVASGASYDVQVVSTPAGQGCATAGGTGTMAGANITSVIITCTGDSNSPTAAITNLHASALVETGFAIGTASDDVALSSVEVSLDGGAYTTATGTASWRFPLPTGSSTWLPGSIHTVTARSKDMAGNYSPPVTVSVRKATNRDVNGDGYPDVIVGARLYNTSEGRAYIFHSSATGPTAGNAASANTILTGIASSAFGTSVDLGDINGDGYADAVVGAFGNASNPGWAFIFHSSGAAGIGSSTATSADTVLTGESNGDSFGNSVAVGDVNGDGYADVAAGAYYSSSYAGKAYVFHSGGATGIGSTGAGSAASILTGETANNYFGRLALHDLNGDGFEDLIVGASGYAANTGRVYAFHSAGASGIASTGAASATSILTGAAAGDWFGVSVAGGDVNGDAFGDIIVGAIGFASYSGQAFIFHSNGGSGIPTMSAAFANTTITGEAGGDRFGMSVALGDVNGDGYADALVGAQTYYSNTGRAYVFHSTNAGVLASGAGAADTMMDGASATDLQGTSAALSDLNGDGFQDALVGASGSSTNTGLARIYYSSGSAINAAPGTILTGEGTTNYFGVSLR